jgi:hypothetical protein
MQEMAAMQTFGKRGYPKSFFNEEPNRRVLSGDSLIPPESDDSRLNGCCSICRLYPAS